MAFIALLTSTMCRCCNSRSIGTNLVGGGTGKVGSAPARPASEYGENHCNGFKLGLSLMKLSPRSPGGENPPLPVIQCSVPSSPTDRPAPACQIPAPGYRSPVAQV